MKQVLGRSGGIASVAVFAALVLSGCSSGNGGTTAKGDQTAHRGGTLTVLEQPGDTPSLDPAATYSTPLEDLQYATQRSLYDYKPGTNYAGEVPDLATSMPIVSKDSRTVTVRIRGGVRFSPPVNREVTSADVKYAIERGFAASVACPYVFSYFSSVEGSPNKPTPSVPSISGIVTPDPRTIIFRLDRPDGAIVAGALVLPLSAPVPQSYAAPFDQHNPSTYSAHVVSTGPYMVARDAAGKLTGFVPGKSVELVRNPNWAASTDDRPAYLNQIDIKEDVSDWTIGARQVLDGHDLEESEFTPPADLESALKSRPKQENREAGGVWTSISMNTQLAPLNNLDVRRAIVAAINRDAVSDLYGGKDAGPLLNQYLSPGFSGYQQAGGAAGLGLDFMDHPSGDLALAHRYLVKAGFPDGQLPVTLDYATDSDPTLVRTSSLVTAELAPLGIKVHTEVLSAGTLNSRCGTPAQQPDFCPSSWQPDFGDGEAALQVIFDGNAITKTDNYNFSQLNVPIINTAMTAADALRPGSARVAAWVRIDRMITAEAPAIPQNFEWSFLPESSDVHGVMNGELGYDLSYTWVAD
jgi:peptide/nickel transport system substrate-binding protein